MRSGLLHFVRQADPKIGGHSTDIWLVAVIQDPQKRRDARASISHHRVKWHFPLCGLIQKLQSQNGLGGEADGFRDMRLLTAWLVLCPAFGQVQASTQRKVAGVGY